jgi:hypothetical protein
VIFSPEHRRDPFDGIALPGELSILFGGQFLKNVCTVRLTKKAVFERENRIVDGHKQTVKYIAGIAI